MTWYFIDIVKWAVNFDVFMLHIKSGSQNYDDMSGENKFLLKVVFPELVQRRQNQNILGIILRRQKKPLFI